MTLILPRRSLLSYPAGTAPGFDPAHPAARNLLLSAVASAGSNYVSLATGIPLAPANGQSGAPSAGVHSTIGPAITSVSGAKALSGPLDSAKVFTTVTAAGIFRYSPSTVAGYQTIITMNNALGFWIHGDVPVAYLGGDNLSTATLAFNTPYFVAWSAVLGGVGSPVHFVVRNLNTGQIFANSATHSQAGFSGATVLCVGNDTSNEFSNFPLAAAMMSNTFLAPSQLLDWSKDPWSFWYPPAPPAQRKVSYSYSFSPPTTTTGGARVLQRFNRSKLAYPAGSLPGIDPAHPAAQGLQFSAVATSGNMVSLTQGMKGAIIGSPSFSLDGSIGPAFVTSGVGVNCSARFAGHPAAQHSSATIAGIFKVNTGAGTGALFMNSGVIAGWILYYVGGILQLNYAGTGSSASTIPIVANVPYFYIVNGQTPGGTLFLIKRLDTGQTRTEFAASPASPASISDGTYTVGDDNSTDVFAGQTSTVMFSTNSAMTIHEMLAWSADPWSFWYPNKPLELVSDGGTPTPPISTVVYYLMNVG